MVNGKRLLWQHVDSNKHNLADFLADLYKAAPVKFFAQFDTSTGELQIFGRRCGPTQATHYIVSRD